MVPADLCTSCCAHHVVLCEGERVSEAVVHVRLRGGVDDRVDLLRLDHILEQVGGQQIALDELVILAFLDFVQVAQAAAVIELVEVDDLVLPESDGVLVKRRVGGCRRRHGWETHVLRTDGAMQKGACATQINQALYTPVGTSVRGG